MSSKKIAVVTAVFLIGRDSIDEYSRNFDKIDEYDYILFTNDKSKLTNVDHWKVIELNIDTLMNTTICGNKSGIYATKRVKWLTHEYLPEYDTIIWVDSYITPNPKYLENIDQIVQSIHLENQPKIHMRCQHFTNVSMDIQWCLNHSVITRELAGKIAKYLDEKDFSATKEVQTYWSSAMIKNNRDPGLIAMAYELIYLVENIGYRDQHWLPYLFEKHNVISDIIRVKPMFMDTGKHIQSKHKYAAEFTLH
jgi:hypothetical protein